MPSYESIRDAEFIILPDPEEKVFRVSLFSGEQVAIVGGDYTIGYKWVHVNKGDQRVSSYRTEDVKSVTTIA